MGTGERGLPYHPGVFMAYATCAFYPISTAGRFGAAPCDRAAFKRLHFLDIEPVCPQDLCLEEGEFVITSPKGMRYIAIATGRTRFFNGFRGPTLDVYEVDTVVEMVGDLPVIVGRRGQKLDGGTWITSEKALR